MWRLHRRTSTAPTEALEDAKKNLSRVKARGPEVTREAETARNLRERNHFADQVYDLFSGREAQTE